MAVPERKQGSTILLYIEPHLIRAALGSRAKSLPFVCEAVSTNDRLMDALRPAFDDLGHDLEELQTDQIVLAVAEALLAVDVSARGRSSSTSCASAVERAREFLDQHHDRIVTSEELETVTGQDRRSTTSSSVRHRTAWS